MDKAHYDTLVIGAGQSGLAAAYYLRKANVDFLVLEGEDADNVIVSTGTNPNAYVPAFAADLDKGIVQIHSSAYTNPQLFPALDTLVVGPGHRVWKLHWNSRRADLR